jgi:succinate dehydrogenase flavin-adding protein (antitoxin of CptAB toxin-antitoxin module)
MKELDVLLSRWLEQGYGSVSSAEQASFRRLLELPETDLARYLLGNERPADTGLRAVVAAVLSVPTPVA